MPIDNFTHGQKVKLTYRGKACAVGWLQFVGGTHGEMRKYGQTTIGKGKSLVMVQEVTVASVRPAFPFKATPEHPKQSYDHTKVTLRKAFDLHKTNEGALIAWPTERIQVQLESIVPHLETPQDHPLNTEDVGSLDAGIESKTWNLSAYSLVLCWGPAFASLTWPVGSSR